MVEWLKSNILSLIAVILAAVQVVQGFKNPSSIHILGWIVVGILLVIAAWLQVRAALLRRTSSSTPVTGKRQV